MTDRVWLVRHASTSWTGRRWCGRTDLPLSPAGRVQAIDLAGRLDRLVPADAPILTSPARRAVETARQIATTGRSVEIMDELREIDFGRAEGRTWSELERDLPALAAAIASGDAAIDWPDGESAAGVRRRAVAVRERVEGAADPLVLVTHGGLIGAMIQLLGGSCAITGHRLEPATALALRSAGRTWRILQTGRD